ncbi:uncharacterized protein LOC116341643 [Contarinia nasturtii]|uniref:uncharacterized protein LOC116341643 n=1 Tax=Contarinia nasturtii TaxID=265458 RepID=UPI0012D42E1C|nr:uncharacterized protein LOC116341643 [Contarinia nasturtii]
MSKLMLFGCSLLFLFAILVNDCDSFPYQHLPNREGYVPVYIRLGDTPLTEINPELAIAFHEVAVNGRQLKSNDDYANDPMQEIKIAQIEKRIDIDNSSNGDEHVEPQPTEHKV